MAATKRLNEIAAEHGGAWQLYQQLAAIAYGDVVGKRQQEEKQDFNDKAGLQQTSNGESCYQDIPDYLVEALQANHLHRVLATRIIAIRAAAPPAAVAEAAYADSWLRRRLFSRPPPSGSHWEVDEVRQQLLIRQDPCQLAAPEVFLQLLATRLTGLAVDAVHFGVAQDYLAAPLDAVAIAPVAADCVALFGGVDAEALLAENEALREHLALQSQRERLRAAKEMLSLLVRH